ncbi:MAG: tetraacyldisaccharide 4'-kinase [Deltaproteobacteria bacterium]|nr:tetraacyldisaccharide 4'-kinase [Deltaproteobacteria bacterium]
MPEGASIVLSALSKLYAFGVKCRNYGYDLGLLKTHHSTIPVISVGNISCGGNAKTPLCFFLVEALKKKGLRAVVLSRGYGGKTQGPHQVSSSDTPESVGDEPVMLERADVAVVVARDRVSGAKLIEEKRLGDVIILDDGFQHRRLHRDLDLVSVNIGSSEAIQDFLAARLLPAGRLREGRDQALRRADAVIFANRQVATPPLEIDPRLLHLVPEGVKVYSSALAAEGVQALTKRDKTAEQGLPPCKVAAFCGIANPEGFFNSLFTLGYELVGSQVYADHHSFSRAELDDLRSRFKHLPLVCTAKDAVKIDPSWADGIYVLKVSTKVYPEEDFIAQVLEKVGTK